MSGEDWGPCPACKVPLSRANASRLRTGAVLHVGCKASNGQPTLEEEQVVGLVPGEGPLVQASGPTDYEALGRERYHDTPEAERAAQLPRILEQTKPGTSEPDRKFADGWLAEHSRAKRMLADPKPPAKKERRRISLRSPLTQEQRDAFVMMGPRGLGVTLAPSEAEELRRGLAAEVGRAAAEPKADVVLQALHVAGGANGIGVGEVRPAPPVCPRCLGAEPGVPAGDPAAPHPGPFTPGLCAACERSTRTAPAEEVTPRRIDDGSLGGYLETDDYEPPEQTPPLTPERARGIAIDLVTGDHPKPIAAVTAALLHAANPTPHEPLTEAEARAWAAVLFPDRARLFIAPLARQIAERALLALDRGDIPPEVRPARGLVEARVRPVHPGG